ncbi:hypothetical protein D3874_03050 [Oleomonas cavernae]|uniref:Uncharacterized protein n=1 Tax=Oleomonas cavernae TaxID=2320859 RepID=A0A418WU94_9PROT|nr:hypothetical protein D3874_03050 [Oleomonas cavernae]
MIRPPAGALAGLLRTLRGGFGTHGHDGGVKARLTIVVRQAIPRIDRQSAVAVGADHHGTQLDLGTADIDVRGLDRTAHEGLCGVRPAFARVRKLDDAIGQAGDDLVGKIDDLPAGLVQLAVTVQVAEDADLHHATALSKK